VGQPNDRDPELAPESKALKDFGVVKDRVSLINLKRLVEKAPEAAEALIQKAKNGEKITRAQVSHELAPFAKRKKQRPGEQSALRLVPTQAMTDVSPPVPSSETSVSIPASVTGNDSTVEGNIPSPSAHQDTVDNSIVTRKPRNREKYSKVAKLLGMMEDADPELMLEKLMDEYLSLKGLAA
jgi:hypothetical protein